MFLHQASNSVGDFIYNGVLYEDVSWELHLHRGFEFIFVTEGGLRILVDEREHTVGPGEGILIMPYQLHALHPTEEGTHFFIAVFSGNYVPTFAGAHTGEVPQIPVLPLPEVTRTYLVSELMAGGKADFGTLTYRQYWVESPEGSRLIAGLYVICAAFEGVEWRKKAANEDLISQVLSYVEANYEKNVTLKEVADALCYEYHYLSRLFHDVLKINFRSLINQCRCERAKEMLLATDAPVARIAEACGFQSIRTFNRIFLELTGTSPTAWR